MSPQEETAHALLAELPANAAKADTAVKFRGQGCGVWPLRFDPGRGDVAYVTPAGGPAAEDDWGLPVKSENAAREFFSRCPEALIGVQIDRQRFVIDDDGDIRRPRQITRVRPRESSRIARPVAAVESEPPPRQAPSIAETAIEVRRKLAEKAELEAKIECHRDALDTLEARLDDAKLGTVRIDAKIGDSAANSVARGEAVPDFDKEGRKRKKLQLEAEACAMAIARTRDELATALKALSAFDATELGPAAVLYDKALMAEATSKLSAAFDALLEPLAEYYAIAELQGKLVKLHYTRRHEARDTVHAFFKNFRVPSGLTLKNVAERAVELAEAKAAQLLQADTGGDNE